MDPPILTPAACEGTTTLFEVDYFGSKVYLSQSGQLYVEAGAMAFGKAYTFGPTFRAEKSKSTILQKTACGDIFIIPESSNETASVRLPAHSI